MYFQNNHSTAYVSLWTYTMYTGAMQMIIKPFFSEQCESYTVKHFNL
jgi:hypothetical protein